MNDPVTVESKEQLVALLEEGNKAPSQWRIGTEHEKFGFHRDSLKALAYDEKGGIRATLEGLAGLGWDPVYEKGALIALSKPDGCSVTLEPGGQLELSGAPLDNIHQTCEEVNTHLREVKAVAEPMDIGFIGLGFHPKWSREQLPWMPKQRYRIMRNYMPKVGDMGIDMMLRTCTVQVNLDYSSEADMVRMFRVSLALQPIATALFANSPFCEGKPNGYLSYRSHAWTRTDPDRCGSLPFVFDSGMGFERWVDHMLDVPMYLVKRGDAYIDASGLSFRDFLAGRLSVLPGELPTVADWNEHLTTAFPEVRLKTFLEMRGADGGPWRRLCALPAFWVGLLYNKPSLDAAWDVCKHWSTAQRDGLRNQVPKLGLAASVAGRSVAEVAAEVLQIANEGLHARRRLDQAGEDETGFLTPLWEIVTSRLTPAEHKLALFNNEWGRSVDPLFREYAY